MLVTRKSDSHEEVDGHTTDSTDPGLHVSQADVEVLLDAILSNLTREVDIEQILCVDLDILPPVEKLIRGRHVLVEHLSRNAGQRRMRHPSTVMASLHLTQLISPDAIHGLVVGSLVILDGDLGSHATHGVDAAAMAGLDEELDVGVHEGDRHSDGRAVRKNETGVLAELLDDAEDVVPATAVETRAVVTELVDDLIHLESSHDGLNQDSSADSSPSHANVILGKVEGIVPETGLEVRLHLGEVEVRAVAVLDGLEGIVIEVETEVEERGGHGGAVDGDVLLVEVPAAGADDQSGQGTVGAELVLLGALLEVDLATVGVVEVDLAVNHVVPGWGAGVWDGC